MLLGPAQLADFGRSMQNKEIFLTGSTLSGIPSKMVPHPLKEQS
jgi:hypothetical protein